MGILDSLFGRFKKQLASPKPEPPQIAKRTRTAVQQVKRPRRKSAPPKVEHEMLREWRAEIKKIQQHPLTQAKIVNERLLAAVMDMLSEINAKLDELNTRISKLETMKLSKKELPEIKLSSGEQKVLDFVKKKKKVQAKDVALNLGISRPNAALKLSKLFSIGQLEKQQDGKDVYYTPV